MQSNGSLWHLPPAPQGLEYRLRTFPEQDSSGKRKAGTHGRYVTTGLFPIGAPNAHAENLAAIPVLFLDCDLADYFLIQLPEAERTKQAAEHIKATLHDLDDVTLQGYVQQLATTVNGALQQVIGIEATYCISSGYGVHAYLWLVEGQGTDLQAVRAAQESLVLHVNARCGFEIADAAVKDAGTRVLRVPGTHNGKGRVPRPVTPLTWSPTRLDLRTVPVGPGRTPSGRSEASSPVPGAVPPVPVDASEAATGFDALFAGAQKHKERALEVLFTECPFFRWAIENADKVGLRSWYGAATNIAALAGEAGRVEFHALSRRDPARYNARQTDEQYGHALAFIKRDGGPWTYASLAANGDWPGPAPKTSKAPAVFAAHRAGQPKIEPLDEPLLLDKEGGIRKVYTNLRRIIRCNPKYGARLRYNEMCLAVEYDALQIVDAFYGDVQEFIQVNYGVPFPLQSVQQAVYEIAWANKYHPVAVYLNGLQWDGAARIERVLSEVLHVEDSELHRSYLRCFFVSAVRRGLCNDPLGVKVDTTLILHGDQGVGKSTFFHTLGGDWFSDTPIVAGSKDGYIALQRHWIIEGAEFERMYGADITTLNAFLTARVDSFRRPYARAEESNPRRCVIVGTTNKEQFLHDPTGDRRFHVLSVPERIDVAKLREWRDQLWAEAVALHTAGVQHWLDVDQNTKRAEANFAFRQEEPWEALLVRWLQKDNKPRMMVTNDQILMECIQKPQDQWRRADTQVIGNILGKLGYKRKRIQHGKNRGYAYLLPGADIGAELQAAPTLLAFPGGKAGAVDSMFAKAGKGVPHG